MSEDDDGDNANSGKPSCNGYDEPRHDGLQEMLADL